MRKLLLAAIAALAALLTAGSAEAIVNGEPDGNRHPYVVALRLIGPDGMANLCTGTLVSPTVIVTAGHCTYGVTAPVFVWNSPLVMPFPPASAGRAYTSPDFSPTFLANVPNTGDLGVVRLEFGPPIGLSQYGQLPAQGYLENLGRKRGHELDVTLVGYGLQSLLGPAFERMTGKARIQNLNSSLVRDYGLKVSGVNGSGRTGSCLGDSGGPILHEDSNVVVAVHSFGDVDTCEGANYAYRTDSAAARSFLGQFVSLP